MFNDFWQILQSLLVERVVAGGGEILRSASDRAASLSKHWDSGGKDLLALLAQLALRPDVPVERHGFDPELSAFRLQVGR